MQITAARDIPLHHNLTAEKGHGVGTARGGRHIIRFGTPSHGATLSSL